MRPDSHQQTASLSMMINRKENEVVLDDKEDDYEHNNYGFSLWIINGNENDDK